MNFRRSEEPDEGGIPLTSLLDIISQLILFFTVTYSFQQAEKQMQVRLPQSSQKEPVKMGPEQIIINIAEDGSVIVHNKKWTMEDLREALTTMCRVYSTPPVAIIRADADVKYRFTVDVLDACASSGIHTISFVTVRPTDRPD